MPSPSDKLMREFKGDLRASLPLHPKEKALVWIAAIYVCSVPWMIGGMRAWAQFIALGLGFLAFVFALLPRCYDADHSAGKPFILYMPRKLLLWPPFWFALLFFAYVLTQALNPAYEFMQLPSSWGMRNVPHITWLPSGVDAPFDRMNTWRQMMIWGAPTLLACALWTGFTRRKSVIALLTAVVANATLLAIVGIIARATANGKILWLVQGVRDYAFGSFVYKNHAGSFFALTTGLTLALAVYHHLQADRHQRRSSPAPLYVFLALIQLIAVCLTYSRGAIVIVAIFLVFFGLVAGVRLLAYSSMRQIPLLLAVFLIGTGAFLWTGSRLIDSDKTLDRLQRLTDKDREDYSVLSRQTTWQAGWTMANDEPLLGWGAGGFRFLFPRYQAAYPAITWANLKKKKGFLYWEHAHNDHLELLIETGRVGASIVALGLIVLLGQWFRRGGSRQMTALTLVAAGCMTLVHGAMDFPFQNPAILATFATAFLLAVILPGLEGRRGERQITDGGSQKAES